MSRIPQTNPYRLRKNLLFITWYCVFCHYLLLPPGLKLPPTRCSSAITRLNRFCIFFLLNSLGSTTVHQRLCFARLAEVNAFRSSVGQLFDPVEILILILLVLEDWSSKAPCTDYLQLGIRFRDRIYERITTVLLLRCRSTKTNRLSLVGESLLPGQFEGSVLAHPSCL